MSTRLTGTVTKHWSERDYGFIQPDHRPGSTLFVHQDNVRGLELHRGDRVTFIMGVTLKGQKHAVDVRVER